jgi:hypothetical protein
MAEFWNPTSAGALSGQRARDSARAPAVSSTPA